MKPCRTCKKEISEEAAACPHCGAPYPAQAQWTGYGFEYQSPLRVLGLPLLHISFKYAPNRKPVVARGIVAIGQFAYGVITISQFGIGLFSLGQFTLSGFALAQFSCAYALIAQFGLYVSVGHGPFVRSLPQWVQHALSAVI